MEDKNVKQKEFWSGAGGDVWVNKQKEMDIMLNPLGQRAIDKLDLSNYQSLTARIRYRQPLQKVDIKLMSKHYLIYFEYLLINY